MSKTITDMTTALTVLALNIAKKRREMFDPKHAPANATKFSVVSDSSRHVVDLTALDREEINTLFRTMVKNVEDKKSGSFVYISRTEDTIMSRAVNTIEARIFNADYFYESFNQMLSEANKHDKYVIYVMPDLTPDQGFISWFNKLP